MSPLTLFPISVMNSGAYTDHPGTLSIARVDFLDTAGVASIITQRHWCPGVFMDAKRAAKRFISTHLLVYDVDGGISMAEVKRRVVADGLQAVVAATKNHQREKNGARPCDRFRVILFLESPARSSRHFKQLYLRVGEELLDAAFDPACCDTARFFFRCRPWGMWTNEGALLSPGVEEKIPPPQYLNSTSKTAPRPFSVFGAVPSEGKCSDDEAMREGSILNRRILRRLREAKPAISGKLGRVTTFSICAFLRNDCALSLECALEFLERRYNPRCEPPWSYEELVQLCQNARQYAKKQRGAELPSG